MGEPCGVTMTARLAVQAIAAALLSTVPAAAADRLYRLDPSTWTVYSGQRSLPAVKAPDGSSVTPFIAPPTGRGNVGPAGYTSTGNYQTGLVVFPGGLDEFSIFYQYLSGDHAARFCADGRITGQPTHQCLTFDGATGAITSIDPAIVGYSTAQITDAPGWRRVSIIFRTAVTFTYGDQAFPYVQVNPGQRFALWRGFLVTGWATP